VRHLQTPGRVQLALLRLYAMPNTAFGTVCPKRQVHSRANQRLTLVGEISYTCNDSGNLTSDGTYTYTWPLASSGSPLLLTYVRSAVRRSENIAGRLVGVESVTTTVVYTYNGDGARVVQEVDGVETHWVQTLASHCTSYNRLSNSGCGLPQVLVEYTSGETTLYAYGLSRLAQIKDDEAEWFLGDALGSVRQLVDDGGNVVLARDYTPFGQPLAESGTGSSGYAFTGEQYDVSTGLVFLRARHYQYGTGRFLSQDSWEGSIYQPQTLHKYVYVLNNAVNHTDPTGHYRTEIWSVHVPPPPDPSGLRGDQYRDALLDWLRWIEWKQDIGRGEPRMEDYAEGAMWELYALMAFDAPEYRVEVVVKAGLDPTLLAILGLNVCNLFFGKGDPYLTDVYAYASSEYKGGWEQYRALTADPRNWDYGQTVYVPPTNSRHVPYPTIIDPRTNEPIPFPRNPQKVDDESLRVQWDSRSDRAEYIRQWHEMGYAEPAGGWELYDIHHILPREFGGSNDFWNLVPVLRQIHNEVLTPWWNAY
jgi:RHS repeat-associated protein